MTFDDLIDFLAHRMTMSHIYQPVVIEALVDAGGTATVRQLAQSLLLHDESQLRYYEDRIKTMPVRVLSKRGVVARHGDLVTLTAGPLTFEQRSQIKMLCQQRLQQFIQRRGLAVWDYRLLDGDPVPDSLRYLVLRASGGRCALCGISSRERPLDVDHIIPRSRGGKNTIENLQVLCSTCNRAKRNRDATDFRDWFSPENDPACMLCAVSTAAKVLVENRLAVAIEPPTPVVHMHRLVVPKRHVTDFFSMSDAERRDADDLLRYLRVQIEVADPSVQGFQVRSDSVDPVGVPIRHAQIHLIPRRLRN